MELSSIRPSITSMSMEEQIDIHVEVRRSRKIPKKPTTKKKTSERKDRSALTSAIGQLTDDQRQALIDKLKGKTLC